MAPPSVRHKFYAPTTGVRADFKKLMNMFISSATVRYEQFSEIWRALNMSYLCAGRNTDREAREFIEKVFVIAREYFLPPYQFQVRVGGLYLLYAVYQIQPFTPKAKIRITPEQWEETMYFQQQASQQSHLDVVYVFNKLIEEQAFQFCFTSQEMGAQTVSNDIEDADDDLADDMKEEKSEINKLFSYESMEQLSYLQDQYQKMKVGLAGPQATRPDKSLDVVKEELVEDIVLSLQSFKEKIANLSKTTQEQLSQKKKEEAKKPQTIGNRRQALKNKAYSSSPSTNVHVYRTPSSSSPEKEPSVNKTNEGSKRDVNQSLVDCESSNEAPDNISSPQSSPIKIRFKEAHLPLKAKSRHSVSSMPSLSNRDNGDLSSGDDSDEDVSPSKRGRALYPRPKVKIASWKNHRPKKSASPSPPPSPEKDRDEPSPQKVRSGFRITWTPLKKPGSVGKSSAFEKSQRRDHPRSATPDARNSSKDPVGDSLHEKGDASQPETASDTKSQRSACPQQKEKPAITASTSSYQFYMAPVSRDAYKNIGNNNTSPTKQKVISTKVPPKTRSKRRGRPPSQPPVRSTYKVTMMPTSKNFPSDIFYNAPVKDPIPSESEKLDYTYSTPNCLANKSTNSDKEAKSKENVTYMYSTPPCRNNKTTISESGGNQQKDNIKQKASSERTQPSDNNAEQCNDRMIVAASSKKLVESNGENSNPGGVPEMKQSFPKAKLSHSMKGDVLNSLLKQTLSARKDPSQEEETLPHKSLRPSGRMSRYHTPIIFESQNIHEQPVSYTPESFEVSDANIRTRSDKSNLNPTTLDSSKPPGSQKEQTQPLQAKAKGRISKYYTPIEFKPLDLGGSPESPHMSATNHTQALYRLMSEKKEKLAHEENLDSRKGNSTPQGLTSQSSGKSAKPPKMLLDSLKFI